MRHSDISHELVKDYARTCYQVNGFTDSTETFTLHVNQYSESMFQLLAKQKVSGAAIITAYNPLSQIQSDEKNRAAHEMLLRTLWHYSVFILDSINIDPFGIWPEEKSICIFGLNLESARSIGNQFNQNAIVWIGKNAVPRLILLR